jgi:hypothetical protein
MGYNIDKRPTNTPEEEELEKVRVKNNMDNARKQMRKDLDIIAHSELRWEDKDSGDFLSVSLTSSRGMKNGHIYMSFTPELAKAFAQKNLITPYPVKLLQIDNRKPTAYAIGRKLWDYYNIYRNQDRGTNDRISVLTLLRHAGLPSYDEIQRTDRGHWDERLKEPLEKALEDLVKCGLLKKDGWKYSHAKGVDLTDEEEENISTYEIFSKLYIRFELDGAPDNAKRREEKREDMKRDADKRNGNTKKRTTKGK